MQHSIWIIPKGGYLAIPSSITRLWSSYKQKGSKSLEAGGILLGKRRNPHIELVMITQPQKEDVMRRNSFDRISNAHGEIATKAWADSSGYVDYLGEWHTRPECSPEPSSLDLSEMSSLADTRKPDIMLSVIVGINQLWIGAFQRGNYLALEPH